MKRVEDLGGMQGSVNPRAFFCSFWLRVSIYHHLEVDRICGYRRHRGCISVLSRIMFYPVQDGCKLLGLRAEAQASGSSQSSHPPVSAGSSKGPLIETPNRELQEYVGMNDDFKDPGRCIQIIVLLCSWGLLYLGSPVLSLYLQPPRLCLSVYVTSRIRHKSGTLSR